MAIVPVIFAFFSGVGYLALQALYFNKMILLSENPTTALAVHYYLLLVTILVASYIVEARPSQNPERWLRRTGFVIVLTHGAAFLILNLWHPAKPGALAAWIGGVALTLPAIASGIAFGKFVQIVVLNWPGSTLRVLCAIAAGAFIAAPRTKFLVTILGSPVAFTVILLVFVSILTVLPVHQQSEDLYPDRTKN